MVLLRARIIIINIINCNVHIKMFNKYLSVHLHHKSITSLFLLARLSSALQPSMQQTSILEYSSFTKFPRFLLYFF